MITQILDALQHAPKGKSKVIDRAKGEYKYPENFKELKQAIKWRLRK